MNEYDYVINKPELNEDILMHYGIKGMKWKNHIKKGLNVLQKHAINARGRIKWYLGKNVIANDGRIEKGWENHRRNPNRGYTMSNSYAQRIGASRSNTNRKTKRTYGKVGTDLKRRGYNNSTTFDMLDGREIGRINDATRRSVGGLRPRSRKKRVISGVGKVYKHK